MSATALKARLRGDLKAAMQARRNEDVTVLRELIAALDNAEAVPATTDKYVPRAFGDPAGEVDRAVLDGAAIEALLAAEAHERREAAAEYEQRGQSAEAERLRRQAELVASYSAPSLQI